MPLVSGTLASKGILVCPSVEALDSAVFKLALGPDRLRNISARQVDGLQFVLNMNQLFQTNE